MKTLRYAAGALVLCSALLMSGCATPESRIKKNPEAFAALAPEVQEQVRAGKVDIGFPSAAVELALGAPDRRYTRKTTEGRATEVWSYTSDYTTTDRQRVDARVRGYDSRGRTRIYTDSVWVDVQQRQEYERLRIELENGRIVAIETLTR